MDPDPAARVLLPLGFLADLAASDSFDEVLGVTARWLPSIVEADRASIVLSDDGDLSLIVLADGDREQRLVTTVLPADYDLVRTCVADGRRQNTPDLRRSNSADAVMLRASGLLSALNVPVVSGGQIHGAVNLASHRLDAFDERCCALVEAVASLLASYIRLHDQTDRARQTARTDELTGLLNRRAIIGELNERLAEEVGPPPCLLFLDLDGFKRLNDAYGHLAGDEALRQVARRFRAAIRTDDLLGRLGGDEFLVLLESYTDERSAMTIARRLVDACEEPLQIDAAKIVVRPSVGVTRSLDWSTSVERLLTEADLAMYRAKRSNDRVAVADDEIRRQADLVGAVDRDIGDAIDNGELLHHYQPVRRLSDGEILGCEALLRWSHPVHGPVAPPLIIERVEVNGLVDRFTRWSLNRTAEDLSLLRARIPAWRDKALALNLTTTQLQCVNYATIHQVVLAKHGLQPTDVIVELVESGSVAPGTVAEQALRDLGAQGVIIGLDDFGTGHNVLSYFNQFPVHSIKFDRSMIAGMVESETMRTVVRGLSRLSNDLGIDTLAEGIEREEELEVCRQIGIPKGQGYLLGRPMPLDELIALDPTVQPISS